VHGGGKAINQAMEKAGLVSGMDGRGGREVLMKKPVE
jgi:S-DNA-T family DNA segregation ATPase FtsK/SpoIIIE